MLPEDTQAEEPGALDPAEDEPDLAEATVAAAEQVEPACPPSPHPSSRGDGEHDERTRAEEALRRREHEMSVLADNVPALFSYIDAGGRYRFVNKRYEEWFGVPRAEITGSHYRQVLGEAVYERISGHVQQALLGQRVRFEDVLPYRNGGTRWVSADYVPDTDGGGEVKGFFALVTDITERKRAEEALLYQAQLLANVNDAVISTDEHFVLKSWNPAAELIYGWKAEEVIGRPAAQVLRTELPDAVIEAGIRVGHFHHEVVQCRKDGTPIHIEMKLIALRDGCGHTTGYVGVHRDVSARTRAEEALRESEQRYRTLFEDSPVSLWDEDFSEVKTYLDGLRRKGVKDFRRYLEDHPEAVALCATMVKVIDVNRATLELYKATSRQEFQNGLGTVFGKESYDVFREELVALAEGEAEFESEAITQTLAGDKNCISLKWRVAPGYEQTLSKVYVSIIDITERTRAEKALRESERRYRLMAENATDIIWITDFNLRALYINPAVTRIRGFSVEEVMAHTPEEALTPASVEVARTALAEALEEIGREGPSRWWTLELEHTCKDGSTVWLETTATVLCDEQGRVAQFLGASRDISERKRAEEALHESERRYRLLAENASDIIWMRDLDLRIVYVNPAITRIRGYSVEEAMALSLEETLTPASLELARRALAEQSARNRTVENEPSWWTTLELEHRCKDGSTVWLEVKAAPLRDDDGQAVGILGVSRDISERKRAEEALQKTREELDSRVERRMRRGSAYGLTFRELTVLHLVMAGKSDKEIGAVLGISTLTASKHVANILRKMGASSRTEASVRAVREDLLD